HGSIFPARPDRFAHRYPTAIDCPQQPNCRGLSFFELSTLARGLPYPRRTAFVCRVNSRDCSKSLPEPSFPEQPFLEYAEPSCRILPYFGIVPLCPSVLDTRLR